jgi:uncharacterized membrane protein
MSTAVHHFVRSRPHLSLAIALGAVAGYFLPGDWVLLTRTLTAWNIAVWFYLVTMGWMMMRASHGDVKRIAARQDERGAVILAALAVAAVMSIIAIIGELAAMRNMAAVERGPHYALVVLTLLGSWFLLGTLFCFHYAHLYYQHAERPLLFPVGRASATPDYWDFLYFSFTIAVAAQTSDVVVQSLAMRRLVLGQSVLSFFFNLLILGLSINIAASLLNT